MIDQIQKLVRQHLAYNSWIKTAIPQEQTDAVNQEVATQISYGLADQVKHCGSVEELLLMLQNETSLSSPVSNAIEEQLTSSLKRKFYLSPLTIDAIVSILPGLLQHFAQKAYDPSDNRVTAFNISKSLAENVHQVKGTFQTMQYR